MSSLKIIDGPQLGKQFELARGIATVGRDQTNSIQVLDFEISRRHAEFHFRGEEFWIFDLKSSNGTYLNGDRIESAQLAAGDKIRIGQTTLQFVNQSLSDSCANGIFNKDDTIQNLAAGTVMEAESDGVGEEVADWIARAKSNIQVMYQTALATSNNSDSNELVERLLDLVFTWSAARRACVLLMDDNSERLIPTTFRHVDGNEIHKEAFEVNQSVVDYVVRHLEGVISPALSDDERFEFTSNEKDEVLEVICVPIRGRAGVRGIIYIDRLSMKSPEVSNFNEEQFKLMIAIGHQAAVAIENADYYQALLDSERVSAVGNVMASLSHHIKNILQSINGGTHLIEDGLKKRNYDLVQNGWQIVQRNQDTMSNLVMDMLSFSRKRELNLKSSDLCELARGCIKSVERRAAYCGVTVEIECESELKFVDVDRELIQRALHNILTTSINSCRDNSGGLVNVLVSSSDELNAEIVVSDNGVGLSDEELDTVFDPLAINEFSYRTGIHMAVSKKIVVRHGGSITVAKNSEHHQGTVFTVLLPFESPAPVVRDSVQATVAAEHVN